MSSEAKEKVKTRTEEFPVGSIVYYIKKTKGCPSVDFGTVDECFPSVLSVQLYDLPDLRLIEGVPVKDFETPTKWRKFPSKRITGTCFPSVQYEYIDDYVWKERKYRLDEPDDMLAGIADGFRVKVQDVCYTELDVEIDKSRGWRIVKKINPSDYHPSHIALSYHEVYKNFWDAQKIVNDFYDECDRIANLTDREWAFEQAQKVVRRYAEWYGLTDEQIVRYYEKIAQIDDIEKLDFRIYEGTIQFKYEDKKRWSSILLD